MTFEFNTVTQSKEGFTLAQNTITLGMADLQDRSGWSRLLALPAGIAMACIEVAKTITLLGEVIIKSLANILTFPFIKKAGFFRGIKQLCGDVPATILRGATTTALALTFIPVVMLYDSHILNR